MSMHEGWLVADDVEASGVVGMRMKVWIDELEVDVEWSCGKVRYVAEFANRPMPVPVDVEMRKGRVIYVRVRDAG